MSLLTDIGFTDVQRLTEGPDSEPWHLNLIARREAATPLKQTDTAEI